MLLLVIIYCNFQFPKTSTKEKLTRFDYTGNALFLMGATAVVLALTWAGHPYAFSSTAVLVPLLVGLAMMASLGFVERTAVEPALPLQLLSNRTSAIGYATCFVHLLLVLAIVYYVGFNCVRGRSLVMLIKVMEASCLLPAREAGQCGRVWHPSVSSLFHDCSSRFVLTRYFFILEMTKRSSGRGKRHRWKDPTIQGVEHC